MEGNWKVLMILIILFVVLLCTTVFILNVIIPFIQERKIIKMQILHSEGEEQEFWKEELKYLYIRQIPIIRNFYYKSAEKDIDS